MNLVVDASVVVAILTDLPSGAHATARFAAATSLRAPELLDLEILSALRRLRRHGEISEPDARRVLNRFARLPVLRVSHRHLVSQIWELRDRLTAYDAAYVALAQALDGTVLTLDRRLVRAAPPGRAELVLT